MSTYQGTATEIVREFKLHGGSGATYCDIEVSEAVDNLYAAGYAADADYYPYITDRQFYEAVTLIDANNFPTLAAEGIIHPSDIMDFMFSAGLGDKMRCNEKSVAVAKYLNISPADYMDIYSVYAETPEKDESKLIQALELAARLRKLHKVGPYNGAHTIVHDILMGRVRYEDAEAVGFERCVARGKLSGSINQALHSVRSRTAKFTMEDLLWVLDSSPIDAEKQGIDDEAELARWAERSAAARIDIMIDYGAEVGRTCLNPLFISQPRFLYNLQDSAGKRTSLVLAYIDRLYTATNRKADLLPPSRMILELEEAGVDPEMVIKEYTYKPDLQRILAIHEGSAPALTDGWL